MVNPDSLNEAKSAAETLLASSRDHHRHPQVPPQVSFVTTVLSLPLSRAAGARQVWSEALPCPALLWPCWGLAQVESPSLHPWNTSLPPLRWPRCVAHTGFGFKGGLKSRFKCRSRYSSYWQGSSFWTLRNPRDLSFKWVRPQRWQKFHSPLQISPSFYLPAQDNLKYSVNRHCRVFMIHGSWYLNYFTLC